MLPVLIPNDVYNSIGLSSTVLKEIDDFFFYSEKKYRFKIYLEAFLNIENFSPDFYIVGFTDLTSTNDFYFYIENFDDCMFALTDIKIEFFNQKYFENYHG